MNEADNTTGENCTRAAPAPSYLALHESGELARRVGALERLLTSCRVCPLDCGNDRTRNELARCFSAALPVVSSYTAHFGEEPALVGTNSAGNIFFGNCNSRNNPFKPLTYRATVLSLTAFDG